MRMTNGKAAAAAGAIIVVLASALVARGDTMSLAIDTVGPSSTVGWSLDSCGNGDVPAGVFHWAGGVRTFWVQIEENISDGRTMSDDVVDPSQVPDGGMGNDPCDGASTHLVDPAGHP